MTPPPFPLAALADEETKPSRKADLAAEEIRALLSSERVRAARERLVSALKDSPQDPELLRIQQVLALSPIKPSPILDGDRSQELEWLAKHSDDPRYQGKWIALLGPVAVVVAESYQDLISTLAATSPPRTPLVHWIG